MRVKTRHSTDCRLARQRGRYLSRLGVREELQPLWLASRHGYKIIDGRLIALS